MKQIIRSQDKRGMGKIDALQPIYIVGCWVRWGVMHFPFAGWSEDNVPLVYMYNDHNGTADQYELVPITRVTTGYILMWSFSEQQARYIADRMNNLEEIERKWARELQRKAKENK